jgi:hypothetical protein
VLNENGRRRRPHETAPSPPRPATTLMVTRSIMLVPGMWMSDVEISRSDGIHRKGRVVVVGLWTVWIELRPSYGTSRGKRVRMRPDMWSAADLAGDVDNRRSTGDATIHRSTPLSPVLRRGVHKFLGGISALEYAVSYESPDTSVDVAQATCSGDLASALDHLAEAGDVTLRLRVDDK